MCLYIQIINSQTITNLICKVNATSDYKNLGLVNISVKIEDYGVWIHILTDGPEYTESSISSGSFTANGVYFDIKDYSDSNRYDLRRKYTARNGVYMDEELIINRVTGSYSHKKNSIVTGTSINFSIYGSCNKIENVNKF